MESLASCLSSFASAAPTNEEGSGRTQAWRGSPFSVKSGRAVWSAASDGNWLVFVKKDLGLPVVDTGYHSQVLKYLEFKPQGALDVEMDHLKGYAGPLPDTRDFDVEEQRKGIIFRVVVNLKRLACLLEPLVDKRVKLWDGTPTGLRCVVLEGDGWRIILGGIDRDPDEPPDEDEGPIVTFQVKPKSAFDQAMALLEED